MPRKRGEQFVRCGIDEPDFSIRAHRKKLSIGRELQRRDGRNHWNFGLDVGYGQRRECRPGIAGGRAYAARIDPGFDRRDVRGRQWIASEWHAGLDFPLQHHYQATLVGLAWDDHRPMRAAFHQQIEFLHHEPAHLGRAGVTCKAVLLQDGRNIRAKIGR